MTGRLYTQQQIADFLGKTRRAINKRANKQGWVIAKRETVRGGEAIFHSFDALPSEVRQKIERAEKAAPRHEELRKAQEQIDREAGQAGESLGAAEAEKARREEQARLDRRLAAQKKFDALPKDSPKRARAHARLWMIRACSDYQRERGSAWRKVREQFSHQVMTGEIAVPNHVAECMPRRHGKLSVSGVTLERWTGDFSRDGLWGLTDGYGNRAGDFRVLKNERLYRLVLGAMVKNPHINAVQIKAFLAAQHPELDVVSEGRLREFMEWWKSEFAQVWTFISNPDRWKNIYMAAAGSMFENMTALNQLWELDSTPGDWLLKDGRHVVVGAIDLYSRRLKFFVSKTSTAAAVKQVLRRCMLAWGKPGGVRTDNGKDYVAEDVDSVLLALDIVHEVCIPFASEQKGTIERAMRTMSHGLLELLPGFIGHNVAERKEIEARKAFAERVMKRGEVVEVALTAAELQAKLDDWCEHVYAKNPHEGLGGKTPWEVANAWTTPVLTINDEHALDALLADGGGTRTISKKGIKYDNRVYIDPTGVLYEHVGREVTIRLDEQDIGRLGVYLDGSFLCWALDPDTRGINRREAAAAIKHHQKKVMREQAAELKSFTKEIKTDIGQAVLDHRIAESDKVRALPKRTETFDSPALREAAKAATAARAPAVPEAAPMDAETARLHAELKAGIRKPAQVRAFADPQATHAANSLRWRRRMNDLKARKARGETITDVDERWMADNANQDWARTDMATLEKVARIYGVAE